MAMAADSPSSSSLGVARRLAHHHQAVLGFLLGLFVSLVLYTTMSGQFGSAKSIVILQSRSGQSTEQNARSFPPPVWSEHNNSMQGNVQANTTDQLDQTVNDAGDKMQGELIRQELNQDGDGNDGGNVKHGAPRKPICDLTDPRYDICEISGDARAIGANRTVLYVPSADERGTDGPEWAIKDQSRKHLGDIIEVKVKTLSAAQSLVAPECTSRHAVPAIVFAMNGIIGNPWHDFSDLLIPLFITTRAYDGEVQFLVTELQPWFVDRYRLVLTNLSRHDIVDFNNDSGVGINHEK